MPGKADWLAYGLPVEPREREKTLVLAHMSREFPRCLPGDRVGRARERAAAATSDLCPVVNEAGILLGLLTAESWNVNPEMPVEQAMQPGPTTIRPGLAVNEAQKMLARSRAEALLVTSSDGKLMGIFYSRRQNSGAAFPESAYESSRHPGHDGD